MDGWSTILEDVALQDLADTLLRRVRKAAIIDASFLSTEMIHTLEYSLLSTLSAIRHIRNSRQYSMSLPPEILSTVFQLVPECRHETTFDGVPAWEPSSVNTSELVPLTHVCRQWRNVALSTPSLWRCIYDHHPSAFLERSLNIDLVVTITQKPQGGHLIHDLLGSHGSRIREMHWLVPYYTPRLFPDPRLNFCAPQLKFLTLQYHISSDFLAPPPFQGHTPQLEYLSLRNSLWLPQNDILSLTRLCLSHTALLFPDFVHLFLSKTPNLEDLILIELKFRLSISTPPVRLAHLQRLTFESMDSQSIREFMTGLTVNSTIAIQTVTSYGHYTNPTHTPLVNLFSIIPTRVEVSKPDRALDIILSLSGSKSALRYLIRQASLDINLCLELPNEVRHHVRELWIHGYTNNTTHPELNGREDWTQLETLVGCDCKLDSILYHLPCSSTTNPPSPAECRCPGLSTIRLILSSPHEYFLSVQQDVAEKFRRGRPGCAAIRLVVELPVQQRDDGPRLTKEVEALFESVEYRFFEEPPTMAYPDVCKGEWSKRYPPW